MALGTSTMQDTFQTEQDLCHRSNVMVDTLETHFQATPVQSLRGLVHCARNIPAILHWQIFDVACIPLNDSRGRLREMKLFSASTHGFSVFCRTDTEGAPIRIRSKWQQKCIIEARAHV